MKRMLLFILIACQQGKSLYSQPSTAMDFTMSDCSTGKVHNLYSILDSGNVVIMEFFMDNCPPCVDAGKALDSMYRTLKQVCPKVNFFQTVFNNTDSCITINKWINKNGFSSIPFDSGAAQISYYGFFAMPTVVVAAGSTHKLLYLHVSGAFLNSDTSVIADSIRNFCAANGTNHTDINSEFISVYPNPSDGKFILQYKVVPDNYQEPGIKQIEIYNTCGKIIYQLPVIGRQSFLIDISSYPSGVYFLKGITGNIPFGQKIFIW